MKQLGFRQKSDRLWISEKCPGLKANDHVSLFLWTCYRSSRGQPIAFELCEFHVTLSVAGHNLHFYFHEVHENHWSPGGYTSSAEIRRLDHSPAELIAEADRIAAEFVALLRGHLEPRKREG